MRPDRACSPPTAASNSRVTSSIAGRWSTDFSQHRTAILHRLAYDIPAGEDRGSVGGLSSAIIAVTTATGLAWCWKGTIPLKI